MRQPGKDKAPKPTKNIAAWVLNRKQFLGSVIAGGLIAQFPITKAFTQSVSNNHLLSDRQLKILQSVQEILFPSDRDGPGANEIEAIEYLVWVISDPNKDPDEIKYIINGIGWMNETADEQHSKEYLDLDQAEKEELVELVSKENWGKSWLSVILSFVFEALLSDPQYGGNPNSIGWNWLDHYPGQPRPSKELLYPEILKTIRKT